MRVFTLMAGFALLAATVLLPAAASAQYIRDQEIEDTLRAYGRPIFEEAGLTPSSVRFILVQRDDLNAFVAGGQNIFVNTGLILETGGPAELLGVIAHETGHISSGHLFRTQEALEDMTMQSMLASILGLAAAIGAGSGEAGMAAVTAGQSVALRGMLRHSRVQESSADQAGVRFLRGAGLPLDGFLTFMEKMGAEELLPETQQSEYMRTHPLTRDRIDFLKNAVGEDAAKQGTRHARKAALPAGWEDRHARMKAKLRGYLQPLRALQGKGDGSISDTYARAIALYRRNRTQDSLDMVAKLLKAEPDNAYFHELKAQILMESGRVAQSVPVYARAVALMPQAGLIRIAYAHALLESGDGATATLDRAIEQLQRAAAAEPASSQLHRLLATAYGRKGDEGLAHLHLAEQNALQRRFDHAIREARLAQQKLPRSAAGWMRAQDIIDTATRAESLKKKN